MRFRLGLSHGETICLERRRASCGLNVERSAFALNVLTHEAYHLASVEDEAAAECYAVQAIPYAANRLGATREQAEALAAYALAHVYSHAPGMYRSRDCRDRGPLDLQRDELAGRVRLP